MDVAVKIYSMRSSLKVNLSVTFSMSHLVGIEHVTITFGNSVCTACISLAL